ncbi:MAG: hypothetical protein ACW98W_18885 [Candidatus Hodarchaeales archaeon]|jgi:hypothetical protein
MKKDCRQFKDGTFSQSYYTEYELAPNEIPSQVFSDFDQNECPVIVQIGANDGICGEQYGFMSWLDSLNNFKLKKYTKNLGIKLFSVIMLLQKVVEKLS